MELLHGMEALRSLPAGGALSIGNFDGVHRGHAGILSHARELAGDAPVLVITFEPHPFTALRPQHVPPRLSNLEAKRELLANAGVDYLIELPPTPDVLGVSAEQFWEIIRDQIKPRHLVEGADFHFGRGRAGTIQRLRDWSVGTGVELHVIGGIEATLLDLHIVPISSSMIRWLIGNGRMRDAAICLGRPYLLNGTVVRGFGRGRQMDMPTANLRITNEMIPMEGVYSGQCRVGTANYPAAISIGRPHTFETAEFQIEAHLIGFSGDLYEQMLNLEFLDWMRDQRQYPDMDSLKKQMTRDLEQVGSAI